MTPRLLGGSNPTKARLLALGWAGPATGHWACKLTLATKTVVDSSILRIHPLLPWGARSDIASLFLSESLSQNRLQSRDSTSIRFCRDIGSGPGDGPTRSWLRAAGPAGVRRRGGDGA